MDSNNIVDIVDHLKSENQLACLDWKLINKNGDLCYEIEIEKDGKIGKAQNKDMRLAVKQALSCLGEERPEAETKIEIESVRPSFWRRLFRC